MEGKGRGKGKKRKKGGRKGRKKGREEEGREGRRGGRRKEGKGGRLRHGFWGDGRPWRVLFVTFRHKTNKLLSMCDSELKN